MNETLKLIFKSLEENVSQGTVVKIITILSTISAVFAMFSYATITHNPQDPLPQFKIIGKEKEKEFGALTVKADVGLYIKNFSAFDLYRNNFIADCVVWFRFAPDQAMLEAVDNFSFDNGNIIKKSPPDIKIESDKIVVKYDVRLSFRSDLDYKDFPLGDHRITLVLTNNFVTPREMFYNVTDTSFSTDKDMFIPNWKVRSTSVESGYLDIPMEHGRDASAPKVRFTVNLEKKGAKKAFVIFVPLFMAIFLALFSFLSSTKVIQQRFFLASSSVPTLLGYRFVLENLLPTVAYFTTTDRIYIMLLATAFVIFMFQAIVIRYANRYVNSETSSSEEEKKRAILNNIDTVVFFMINIGIVSGTALSIFY